MPTNVASREGPALGNNAPYSRLLGGGLGARSLVWSPRWRKRLAHLTGAETEKIIQAVTLIIEATRETELAGALALVLESNDESATRLQKDLVRTSMVAGFRLAVSDAEKAITQPTHTDRG